MLFLPFRRKSANWTLDRLDRFSHDAPNRGGKCTLFEGSRKEMIHIAAIRRSWRYC